MDDSVGDTDLNTHAPRQQVVCVDVRSILFFREVAHSLTGASAPLCSL